LTARDRRHFLKFLGAGLTGAYAAGLGPLAAAAGPPPSFLPFDSIRPTTRDDLVLPEQFIYDIVAEWGDPLPGTNARFGYNADFTAFIPLPGNREGRAVRESRVCEPAGPR
jgi:secreted PhoX family phosphatase